MSVIREEDEFSRRRDAARKRANAQVAANDQRSALAGDLAEEIRDDADAASIHFRTNRRAQTAMVADRVERGVEFELSRARTAMDKAEYGYLAPADWEEFKQRSRTAAQLAGAAESLRQFEERQAAVVHEPGPYDSLRSPHSWVRDRIAVAQTDGSFGLLGYDVQGAEGRLRQHGRDVREAVAKRSEYGRRIERMITERHRTADPNVHERAAREELRTGFTTGGGATSAASSGGAAFVPPAILMDVWAAYRSPYRSFADQCNTSFPLPDWGLKAYVPSVTTGSQVGSQTEGSGVAETDPVATYTEADIKTAAGQVETSRQFLDRAGPGVAGDVIVFQQLRNQLDAEIDVLAITEALANAATVTNSGTFALTNATAGVGGFMKDLKAAKSKLTDTAGVRLRGTHCFALDDFVDYIGAYNDAQGRPVFSPSFDDSRLPIRSQGDGTAQGYSGYVLNGLALFGDSNIPNSSSDLQLVVCRADTILLLEAPAVTTLYPQYGGGSLLPTLVARAYVACVPQYPTGVAVISGAAYAATTFA